MSLLKKAGVAMLAGALLSLTFVPGATAQDNTFRCDPGFYQVISGQLAEFDPGAGTYTSIGPDHANYNAMGYRIADGYMYAVSGSELLRIDATGAQTVVATLSGTANGYTGDFDDQGLLHVSRGGQDWVTIDVDTHVVTSVPELSVAASVADIANVNGIFYGVSSNGTLMSFDPAALTVTTVGTVQGLPSTSKAYGAAWATAGGNLYVGRNSGEIYQITGYSTGSPVATQVGSAPATNSNDGSSCALAPPPAGLQDVDGPEPETEPSTPAAQAAAEEYATTYVETAPPPTPAPEPTPEPSSTSSETFEVEDAGIGTGAMCAAVVDEDRPPRLPEGELNVVSQETVLFSSGFDDPNERSFNLLSGSWGVANSAFSQLTDCDYDATALLKGFTVADFRWEAEFLVSGGLNHGGLLFHQSSLYSRSGATLVDLADDGNVVRWGTYDNAGYYQYAGQVNITPPAEGQTLLLGVEVHGTQAKILVDGTVIADVVVPQSSGMVGVVATRTQISFESATLVGLPPTGSG